MPPPSEPLQMSVNIPQPSELKARLSAHLEKEELAAKLASMQNSTNSSQPQQTSNEGKKKETQHKRNIQT